MSPFRLPSCKVLQNALLRMYNGGTFADWTGFGRAFIFIATNICVILMILKRKNSLYLHYLSGKLLYFICPGWPSNSPLARPSVSVTVILFTDIDIDINTYFFLDSWAWTVNGQNVLHVTFFRRHGPFQCLKNGYWHLLPLLEGPTAKQALWNMICQDHRSSLAWYPTTLLPVKRDHPLVSVSFLRKFKGCLRSRFYSF